MALTVTGTIPQLSDMADEPDNLILEHLRRLREGQDALRGDVGEGFSELKHRGSALEQSIGNLQVHLGQMQIVMGSLNERMDRIDDRMDSIIDHNLGRLSERLERLDERTERIERKLGVVDA